ncbi:MAG: phosphate acyltransferase, partial [Rhodospirillaceae bacterium]|nr:phosphate acyltransferase [Rhodospirillaceae bacterium]
MVERLALSVDAMGGDAAPEMVVEGVDIAASRLGDVEFLLFGDEGQLQALLEHYPNAKKASKIHHTTDVVLSDDKPAIALRGRRASSMRLAINAVGAGDAAAVISAGNTGALMAMAKFVLKTLPGIDRPAIATSFPT